MFVIHVVNKVCVQIQFVITQGDGMPRKKCIKWHQRDLISNGKSVVFGSQTVTFLTIKVEIQLPFVNKVMLISSSCLALFKPISRAPACGIIHPDPIYRCQHV